MFDAPADAIVLPAYYLRELLPYPWVGTLGLPLLFLNSLLWGAAVYLVGLVEVRRVRSNVRTPR